MIHINQKHSELTHFLKHICDHINFLPVNENPNSSGENINKHKIIILKNLM